MRIWFFHPLIFYPVAILLAGLAIAVSLRPQSLPRTPHAEAAQIIDDALIYTGAGFDAPDPGAGQYMTVTRDFWGRPQRLRVAVLANRGAPAANERGVRLLMTPEDAARLNQRPVTVEVSYNPLPVNAATGLAVSLQGAGPVTWVTRPIPPQRGTARFEIPAQSGAAALGIRAISSDDEEAFGLEITRIRITPHTSAAAPN